MATATMTSKGQITIPKDVREALKLKEGDKVDFVRINGTYMLRPRNRDVMELAGKFYVPGRKPLGIDEMDEAVGEAVVEEYLASLDRD